MFYFFLLFLCLISFFFFPRVSVWELNIAVLSELTFSVAVLNETCFFFSSGNLIGYCFKTKHRNDNIFIWRDQIVLWWRIRISNIASSSFNNIFDGSFVGFQIMISMAECMKFTSLTPANTVHDIREVPEYYVTGEVDGQ